MEQSPERPRPRPTTRRPRVAPVLALLLGSGPLSGADAPPPVLTLSEALRTAAARSHAAVAAGLDVAAAREATNRAKAPFLPSVSVTGGWFGRDHEVVAIFGDFEVPTTQKNFFVGDLSATLLLWDGGRRAAALSAASAGEERALSRGRSDVLAAQIDALGSYVTVLLLGAQKLVVQQRIASLEGHLREARDLYEQGVVARNDLLGTEVRLRTVKDRIGQLDDGAAVAGEALNRLLGRSPAEPLELEPSLPAPAPLPHDAATLRRLAAEGNPRLLALRARLEVETRAADLAARQDSPSVFAQASHTYQQNEYLSRAQANVLFLGLSWSAFDGGARRAARREADLAVEKTRREIEDATRALEVDVDRAYREVAQALREAATADENTAAAEENLRIVEDQYRAGIARTTEVLDAESVLAESRFSSIAQRYTATLKQGVLLGQAGFDLAAFFERPGTIGMEKR